MNIEHAKLAVSDIKVEAIQVTRENMRDVANWCGGRAAPSEGVYFVTGERQSGGSKKCLFGEYMVRLGPHHFEAMGSDFLILPEKEIEDDES